MKSRIQYIDQDNAKLFWEIEPTEPEPIYNLDLPETKPDTKKKKYHYSYEAIFNERYKKKKS
jgi:hypothetical protein